MGPMGLMVDGVVSQGTPAKRERKQEKINRQADRFDVFSGTQKITKNEFWHQRNLLTDLPKKSTDQQTDR
jgi:hypothetical protein